MSIKLRHEDVIYEIIMDDAKKIDDTWVFTDFIRQHLTRVDEE